MKNRHHKTIVTGPIGAGKPAEIHAINNVAVISTEVLASDNIKDIKLTTTVAMDYGLHKSNDCRQFHLYGTPGQARFDFMWDILTQAGQSLVLWINHRAPDPAIDEYHADLAIIDTEPCLQKPPPIFTVDARNCDDVKMLLQHIGSRHADE